jgi:hypothetical protein
MATKENVEMWVVTMVRKMEMQCLKQRVLQPRPVLLLLKLKEIGMIQPVDQIY